MANLLAACSSIIFKRCQDHLAYGQADASANSQRKRQKNGAVFFLGPRDINTPAQFLVKRPPINNAYVRTRVWRVIELHTTGVMLLGDGSNDRNTRVSRPRRRRDQKRPY